MYNPYILLSPELLAGLLKQPLYFVCQYYERGLACPDTHNIPLLLTHYTMDEPGKERAARHIRLLATDRFRFLYDSTNPRHLQQLNKASMQPEGYRIFVNLLPQQWKADEALTRRIICYIREKMPWWSFSIKDQLHITLRERYGSLFIMLYRRGSQTEVLLNDIENMYPCATT